MHLLPNRLLEVNGVRGYLSPGDIERLSKCARAVPPGGTVVEVGSCMGLSAIVMAHALLAKGNADARIHCVDTWDNRYLEDLGVSDGRDFYATFLGNVQQAGVAEVVKPIRMLSVAAPAHFADGSVDLLFIDGDHSYEGCYADLVAWAPKLRPGGTLVGHDCVPGEGVDRAVRRFVAERGLRVTLYPPPSGHYMYRLEGLIAPASVGPTPPASGDPAAPADPSLAQPGAEEASAAARASLAVPEAKIVGLVPVRNEEAIVAQCLRALSLYTDAIVVLDDFSEDRTVAVVRSLADECHVERILTKPEWVRDEPGDRNRLLQAGREIGGTHFIVIDADEVLTSNLLDGGLLRRLMLGLAPGDQLALTWIHLWRSTRQYRDDRSIWTNNHKAIAFRDEGNCSYQSAYIHTSRTPMNTGGQTHLLQGYTHGLMHFATVNWRNALIKQAWYRCLERIREPGKPAAAINARYAPTKDETGLQLSDCPPQWFSGYPVFDHSIYQLPDTWREQQVLGWFSQYGRGTFADLDIWDVDWGKGQANGSPRRTTSAEARMGHPPHIINPLMVNGQEHMAFGPDTIVGYGARLECITQYGGRTYTPRLTVGEGTTAELFLHIGCAGRVAIGRDCIIAGHVTIMDHDHGYDASLPLHGQPLTVDPVTIGDSVFIGEGAFIGKGVTIGEHAVVGAGAVVVHDVPAHAIVGGVPAKVIGTVPGGECVQLASTEAPLPVETALTSIIILTHNGLVLTQACLESIERYTPEPHEVVVVDNGSSDGTLAWLREEAARRPGLRVVANDANLGFAAGNNQGLAIAQGEYAVLLNNDTEVTEGWLGAMLAHLRHRPELGLVGPLSNRVSGPQQVAGAAYGSSEEMHGYARRWVRKHAGQLEETTRLVGFCLAMRRAVVERIGGLDERFGSGNFEDDDFCLRAAAAGFKLGIARDSFVHHVGGQTFKAAGIDFIAAMQRNWGIFKTKWGLPADLDLNAPVRIDIAGGDASRFVVPLPDRASVHEVGNPLTEAAAALERADLDAALSLYSKAVARYPGSLEARQGLAAALVGCGRLGEAAQTVMGAIALAPNSAALRNYLGVILYQAGDMQGAESALSAAHYLEPGDVQSLLNLVDLTRGQQRYQEATAYLRDALQLDARHPDALALLAGISLELGDQDTAAVALRRLEAVAPDHPELEELRQLCVAARSAHLTPA